MACAAIPSVNISILIYRFVDVRLHLCESLDLLVVFEAAQVHCFVVIV